MLEFFIIFTVTGYLLGIVIQKHDMVIIAIVIISILWAFAMGPWAIATFIELMLGYGVYRSTQENKKG